MKEAFKIGGYAWHAHKRFEALKDGWSFEKTVEWLKTLGIVFNETSIKRFINVYVTYLGADSPNTTLRELYALVNEQAEEILLPREKVKTLSKIFTALPSDDSTNPKELIRELIRAGKVFAVTERTIRNWKPEALKQKRLSQEEVEKIQELKEQGKTQREIAEEIGVNQNTVQHHLNKNDNCQICSDTPDSPEPSNVIPSPVKFQKQEPVDDYDEEDEEDLDIEAPDEDKKVYTVVKKEPSLSGDHYIRYIPLQLGRI